jgi:membrane protein YdbS with pleckstrin-like domain
VSFIEDASKQFPKLWSVRFSLLAAIASAIEAGMHLYASGTAPILVVAAGLTSLGAAIVRVVAQPALTGNG